VAISFIQSLKWLRFKRKKMDPLGFIKRSLGMNDERHTPLTPLNGGIYLMGFKG